jgi:hypothetical protein
MRLHIWAGLKQAVKQALDFYILQGFVFGHRCLKKN